jgi:hypothetical protein
MFPLLLERAEATDNLRRQLAEEREKSEKLLSLARSADDNPPWAEDDSWFRCCGVGRGIGHDPGCWYVALVREGRSAPSSDCHSAPLATSTGDEGTSHYVCTVCKKACDVK